MSGENKLFRAFDLVAQAVIISLGERIEYMNSAAVRVFGRNLAGEGLSAAFPAYLVNVQADSFASTVFVGGQSYEISVLSIPKSKQRVYTMNPRAAFDTDSQLVLSYLRSELMNLRLAVGKLLAIGSSTGDAALRENSVILNRGFYSLKRLVDNMTVVRLLELGELPFDPISFDVTESCRNVIDSIGYMLGEGTPKLQFSVREHYRIVGDRALFEILLINLLVNSIQHCTRESTVCVSLLRTGKGIVLGVNDNGSGIEQGDLVGIFQSYRRTSELYSAEKGVGMGLGIVQGIAQLHGGAVIIESRGKDMGTSVRVTISDNAKAKLRFSDAGIPAEDLRSRLLTQCASLLPDACFAYSEDDN